MPFHQRVPSSSTTLVRTLVCKYGSNKRPVRKSPLLHGRKSTPTPKFLGTAEAYFVCHISPNFQISLIYAFIGCPQSVDRCIVISSSSKLLPLQISMDCNTCIFLPNCLCGLQNKSCKIQAGNTGNGTNKRLEIGKIIHSKISLHLNPYCLNLQLALWQFQSIIF